MEVDRVENWNKFAKHMEEYIRDRTVEKYGVKNSGEATGFDLMSITRNPLICVWNILRYSLRIWNGKLVSLLMLKKLRLRWRRNLLN